MLLDEGKRKKELRGKMISFRLPKSADDTLRSLAKVKNGITPALLDCIGFYERMRAGTLPLKSRLQMFMAHEGLDPTSQEPEALLKLIERGLEAAERNRK